MLCPMLLTHIWSIPVQTKTIFLANIQVHDNWNEHLKEKHDSKQVGEREWQL